MEIHFSFSFLLFESNLKKERDLLCKMQNRIINLLKIDNLFQICRYQIIRKISNLRYFSHCQILGFMLIYYMILT